jgi:hypothetical protein
LHLGSSAVDFDGFQHGQTMLAGKTCLMPMILC